MGSENSKFDGIFSKLGKLVFTEEYISENTPTDTEKKETPVAPTSTGTTSPSSSLTVGAPKKEMIDKVNALVASINKPGIDFFELWNAAEAMGSISDSTVSNAFVALKIASGNTLNKDTIISTGESYCSELQTALDGDVNEKIRIKNKILEAKNNSRSSLSSDITNLNNKIVELQNLLKEKNAKLQNIDADFDPKLAEIDEKINHGKLAVEAVVAEMKNVLSIAARTIKE